MSVPPYTAASTFAHLSMRDGVLTIRPVGPCVGDREVGILTPELVEAVTRAGRGLRAVVIDLSQVSVLASMGLGLLLQLQREARHLRARSVLCGLSRELEDLLRLTRIDRVYTIAGTSAELTRAVAA